MTTLEERIAAQALDDALVTAHLGTLESFPDPRTALHTLEAWNAQVALDPAVSEEAAKLHGRIAALEAALEQTRVALRDARASLHGHGYNAGIIAKVDAVLRAIEEVQHD